MFSTSNVDNVVESLLLAAEKGRGGEAYFVTDGNNATTLNKVLTDLLGTRGVLPIKRNAPFRVAWFMATLIESVWRTFHLGSKPPVTRQILRMIGQEFTLDITKARRELGYVPVISWAEGISRMRAI